MLRSLCEYKAQYHDPTLLGVSEFNEWKVLVYGSSTTIHGRPQFSAANAKLHAIAAARAYTHDRNHKELPILEELC